MSLNSNSINQSMQIVTQKFVFILNDTPMKRYSGSMPSRIIGHVLFVLKYVNIRSSCFVLFFVVVVVVFSFVFFLVVLFVFCLFFLFLFFLPSFCSLSRCQQSKSLEIKKCKLNLLSYSIFCHCPFRIYKSKSRLFSDISKKPFLRIVSVSLATHAQNSH